jgi:hypothetical protein
MTPLVTVECPRCHRPVGRLTWQQDHAAFTGTIRAERPGGEGDVSTVTSYEGGKPPDWAARILSADPSLAPESASVGGRKVIRCSCGVRRGKPGMQRAVSDSSLTAAYQRAVQQGRARISMLDLHE